MSRGYGGHLPDADLEVRKHLWQGLERMQPAQRVAFLKQLCKQGSFHGVDVKVTTSSGTVQECFHDVCMLSFQHGVKLQAAAALLERTLRRL